MGGSPAGEHDASDAGIRRQLAAVTRIAHLMNSPLPLDDLLRELVDLAADVAEAEAASLFRLDADAGELVFDVVAGPMQAELTQKRVPIGVGVTGWVAQHGTPVIVPVAREDERFYPAFDRELGFETRSLLAVPMFLWGELVGVLEAVNKRGEARFGKEDELVLAAFASQAAIAIENARLQQQSLEKARLDQELAIAARIQADLLPAVTPELAGYDLAACMIPHGQVGGDFYDLIPIEPGRMGIIVADGAGKGVPGAMLMAMTRTALNVQVTPASAASDVIAKLNAYLVTETDTEFFVTMIYAALDVPERSLTYTNAGHPPGLLVRDEACIWLGGGGPLLGVVAGEVFIEERIPLRPGDLLALYSDGVTEALNADGDLYGYDRLATVLRTCRDCSAQDAINRIRGDVTDFIAGGPLFDDFTLLVLKVL